MNPKHTPEYLEAWKHPSNYMGAHWDGWYVFLGRNRDSDCLTRANFDAGLALVKSAMNTELTADDDCATVQVVSENHWAVGWVEWIAIHESDKAALQAADAAMARLDNYPVLDENLWSEYEQAEANEVWRDCYRPQERIAYIRKHKSQFEFGSMADLLGCVRGKYFAGYAGELLS